MVAVVTIAVDAVVAAVKGAVVVMVGGDVEAHPAYDQSVIESRAAALQAHWEVLEDGHDGAGGRGVERWRPGEGEQTDQLISYRTEKPVEHQMFRWRRPCWPPSSCSAGMVTVTPQRYANMPAGGDEVKAQGCQPSYVLLPRSTFVNEIDLRSPE